MTDSGASRKRNAAERVDQAYRQRAYLWALERPETVTQRVAACGRVRVAEFVSVNAGGSTASLGGLSTCASAWVCPVCAPKIAARRSGEIEAAIRAHAAEGGEVLLMTLTVAHDRSHALADTWDVITEGWKAVRNSRGWRHDVEDHGIVGWARVVEVTRSRAHGWHPHLHVLLFVSKPSTPATREQLRASVFGRWSVKVADLGYRSVDFVDGQAVGVDVRHVPAHDAQYAAEYLAKHGRHAYGSQDEREAARNLAWEATRSDLKTGRKGSQTPWEILADAHDGSRVARARWREYEDAAKGRRQITWAQGFRASLGLLDAVTDAVAATTEPEPQELVALLPGRTWSSLVADMRKVHRRPGAPTMTRLLAAAARLDPEAFRTWLALEGIEYVRPEQGTSSATADPYVPALAPGRSSVTWNERDQIRRSASRLSVRVVSGDQDNLHGIACPADRTCGCETLALVPRRRA